MNAVIETPRLILRAMIGDDLDDVAALLGDPEVMRFWPRPYSRDEAAAWLRTQRERYDTAGLGYRLGVAKETGAVVGQYGLLPVRPEPLGQGVDRPDLGYITARACWRQGYAAEAARACLAHGFGDLGLDRVYALVRPENAPSRAVAAALGMTAVPGLSVGLAGYAHDVFVAARPGPER